MGLAHACFATWMLLWLVHGVSPAEEQVAGRQASLNGVVAEDGDVTSLLC